MNSKEALLQIKNLLFANQEEVIQEEVVVEFAQGVLADGTIISFDKLEVGGKLSVVTPNGEIPAPIGEHELEDGTIVVVSQEGVIGEIKAPQVAEQVVAETMSEEVVVEEAMADMPIVDAPSMDVSTEIAQLEGDLTMQIGELSAKVDMLNEVTAKLVDFLDNYANQPMAAETQAPKNVFYAQNKTSKLDAQKRLQNIFSQLKK
jgi:(2Fe-2S) ferredoxin